MQEHCQQLSSSAVTFGAVAKLTQRVNSGPEHAGLASPVYDMTGLQPVKPCVAVPTSHSLRWLSVEALTMLSLPSQRT